MKHQSEKLKKNIELLALMQHHGAPTRLIDWTYSFFVAVFFALENAKSDSAIWAISSGILENAAKQEYTTNYDKLFAPPLNEREGRFYKTVFQNKPKPLVYSINPDRLNERLIIQQGVFLCPGDISQPFETN